MSSFIHRNLPILSVYPIHLIPTVQPLHHVVVLSIQVDGMFDVFPWMEDDCAATLSVEVGHPSVYQPIGWQDITIRVPFHVSAEIHISHVGNDDGWVSAL
jgi:hypothetical protein